MVPSKYVWRSWDAPRPRNPQAELRPRGSGVVRLGGGNGVHRTVRLSTALLTALSALFAGCAVRTPPVSVTLPGIGGAHAVVWSPDLRGGEARWADEAERYF